MEKKILKQLKSDYEELEIKPSADLWSKIDSALEEESESSDKSSFSLSWWKYAAVILLFISLGTLIYYNRDFNTEKTDYIVKQNLRKEVPKTENNSGIILQEGNSIVETDPKTVEETRPKVVQNDNKDLVQPKEIIRPQISERTETKIVINQPENKIDQPEIIENKISLVISDKRKISYVSANDLLLGRELDKTREENQKDHKQFGVLDASKIKFRRPNSLQIFGFKVFSDSTATE